MTYMETIKALKLRDGKLFRQQNYINGAWEDADSGKTIEVTNPATAEVLGTVPNAGAAETKRAIQAADAALPAWRAKSAGERSALLRKWFELIMANQEDLAVLMTAEQGKPLAEAKGEIAYAASFVEWFAEEAKRVYGDVIPGHQADKRIVVIKQPIGVVAAITPWNFPAAMITRKISPALAVGCTVVCKPATQTPYSALALAELAERAGIPKGVFNVVTGSAREIGGEMTANPIVRKLTFTGSTEVGKLLMSQCAGTVKKVSLELGGNAPFLVFDDADLDAAVQGAMASKFRNTGQTCVCANRIYVQDGVYDAFAEKLAAAMRKAPYRRRAEGRNRTRPADRQGGRSRRSRSISPMPSRTAPRWSPAASRMSSAAPSSSRPFSRDVTSDMKVASEETFGPVAPLFRFKTEQEGIHLANAHRFGLAAYFYARDISRVWRVAEAIESGIVGINTGIISTAVAPFGGVKESGIGREGSKYGIDDFVEIKYLCMNVS